MKRIITFVLWVGVFVFLTSQLSFAQLINHQRRAAGGYKAPPPAEPAPAPAAETPTANENNTVSANTTPDFKVTNQVEELYDINKDGNLQSDEVKSFLKDVSAAVEKKGNFTISSEVLKQYDKNNDGLISRNELSDIETYIGS